MEKKFKRSNRINIAVTDKMKEDAKEYSRLKGVPLSHMFEDFLIYLMTKDNFKDYGKDKY